MMHLTAFLIIQLGVKTILEDIRIQTSLVKSSMQFYHKQLKKRFVDSETVFNEETGEAKEVVQSKEITVSDTDSECGLFHKGEKTKCFAYSHMTFCDKKGFVLVVKTVLGNEHDSVAFIEAYNELNERFKGQFKNISLDSAFKTAPICRTIIKNGQKFFAPYTRQKGNLKKYDFVYDEEYDFYICPNDKTLYYSTTTKEGYRSYKSDAKDCEGCPF